MKNDLTKIAGILRRKKFELKKEERRKKVSRWAALEERRPRKKVSLYYFLVSVKLVRFGKKELFLPFTQTH